MINILTICFTGRRPNNKNMGGYDWNTDKNKRIMKVLKEKIIELINSTEENHFRFICGGALGIDQMAFHICNYIKTKTLKLNSCKIELVLAMPFEKQASKWFDKESVNKFKKQRQEADEVKRMIDRLIESLYLYEKFNK